MTLGRYGRTLALIVCLLSLALLAVMVQGTELGGDRISPMESLQDIEEIIFPVAMGLWLAVGAYLIYVYLKTRSKVRTSGGHGRPSNLAGLVLFFAILLLVALVTDEGQTQVNDDGSSPDNDPPNIDPTDSPRNGDAGNFAGIAILVALLVIVLIPLSRFAMNRKVWQYEILERERAPLQMNAVDDAIHDITVSTGDDLRDSILRTYHSMLHLMNGRMPDERTLTPREFALRSVSELGWPQGPVQDLTEVFELARYSDHPIGESERAKAIDSLENIRTIVKGVERAD